MPPKKKAAEKGDELPELGLVFPDPESSPSASPASTMSSMSCGSLSAEQLQLILEHQQRTMLEASHKSMTALLATLSPTGSPVSSTPRVPQVKIPKWTDEEIPYEYFVKLEKALTHNCIASSTWGQLLPVYLSGRAQAALAQVDLESVSDYESIKAVLLESLGDTPASADRKWWSLSRLPGEEPGQFYLRLRSIGLKKMQGLKTREDFVEHVVLTRFLSLLSPDCYSFVVSRQPKTGLEAAKLLQEFEESRSFQRRRQPWKDSYQNQHKREPVVVNSVAPLVGGSSISEDGSASDGASGPMEDRVLRQGRKPIICHGCNEPGHIRPNCPYKVRVVKCAEPCNSMFVKGFLAGRKAKKLKVDTGSDRTIVRSDFIPSASYTQDVIKLDSWRGAQCTEHKVARIVIRVGYVEKTVDVAVVDELDCPAVLGSDLGHQLIGKLMSILMERMKKEPVICDKSRVTMQSDAISASSTQEPETCVFDCVSVDWEELDGDGKESLVEDFVPTPLCLEGPAGEAAVPLPNTADCFCDSVCSPVCWEGPVDDVITVDPLPNLADGVCSPVCWEGPVDDVITVDPLPNLADCNSLAMEQQFDPTLKTQYMLAGKKEKGYSFLNEILVHNTLDKMEDFWDGPYHIVDLIRNVFMATEKSAPDVVAWTSAFQCDFFCFYQQFVVISMLMLFIVNSSLLLFILFLMLMLLVVGVLFSSRLCSDGSNCSLPVSSTDEGGGRCYEITHSQSPNMGRR